METSILTTSQILGIELLEEFREWNDCFRTLDLREKDMKTFTVLNTLDYFDYSAVSSLHSYLVGQTHHRFSLDHQSAFLGFNTTT